MAGKLAVIALFALILVAAGASVYLANEYGINGLFCTGCLQGGTVTSVNYVNLTSNYKNITGQGMVASIVLNGKGENLTGFGAHSLNQSYSQGTPVSITTQVTNYGYSFTYYPTPAYYLYNYTITPITNVYFTYSCPFGFTCSQTLTNGGTVDDFTLIWVPIGGNTGAYITPWEAQEAAYAQSCYATSGKPVLLSTAQLGIGSGTFGATYECITTGSNKYAAIFQDNSYTSTYNATVQITNGTKSSTIAISNINPEGYSPSTNVYVIGEGIEDSGYTINPQNIPVILYLYSKGKYILANPFSVPQSLTGAESSTTPAGTFIAQYSSPEGIIYSNQTIINVDQLNSQVQALTFPPVGSAYANMNIGGFSNQSNPVATLSLTTTPTFYAVIQIIAPFKMLGIGIPVAEPIVVGTQGSTSFASGATQSVVFDVKNEGPADGPAYVTGMCNSNPFSSSTAPVFIASGATAQVSVPVTAPINPNSASAQFNCIARAESVGGIYISAPFSFTITVSPQCGAGYTYVNSTGNCASIAAQGATSNYSGTKNQSNTICRAGYTLTGSVCVQNAQCPTGYALNTTITPNVCQPMTAAQPWYDNLWLVLALILIPSAVIVTVVVIARMKRN